MSKVLRTNCKDCKVELNITNSVYAGIRRVARCQECYRKYTNAWVKEHRKIPEILQKRKEDDKKSYFKSNYGITIERYNELLELQLGGCAICKLSCSSGDKLSVDHDHINNQVRGLLCHKCNIGISNFNENENLFINAIEYLKKYKWNKVA